MFGVLKPVLCSVSERCKESYNLTYCNLCAALSASGAGVFNRFFLVNDVVTIDWLLRADKNGSGYAFKCYNCTKGGVIGRKNSVSAHQKFLAAISSYACGVKLRDNAVDNIKIINKFMSFAYKPIMNKAELFLAQFNILEKLQDYQKLDREQEVKKNSDLETASLPTELCYELVTLEDSKYLTKLPQNILSLLGRYLGKCVYFLDAIADMDKDKKTNQYNVLNLKIEQSNGAYDKVKVVGLCLDSLKPMRHDLAVLIDSLPKEFNIDLIKSRWNSLFNGIERQLVRLIKPLNSVELFANMATYNPMSSCAKSSSWSSIYACCCCNCGGCGCGCCGGDSCCCQMCKCPCDCCCEGLTTCCG